MNWQSSLTARRILCAAAAAGLFYGAASVALDRAGAPRQAKADAAAADRREPAGPVSSAAARRADRGWIESKREIPPSGTDPRALTVFEYTARMADGSSNVFLETLPVRWRLGERLTFVGGAGAAE